MVNKEKSGKWTALWVEVLQTRLPLKMMNQKEQQFAEGIVKFYADRGYLTEKQTIAARKLAVRLIVERDINAEVNT